MKSHRLPSDAASPHDVAAYGEDSRTFPSGINHIQNQPVPIAHPLPEIKVGPFIKDVGDGPSVWHGEAPSVAREAVEDEWTRRQKEATMTAGDTSPPQPEQDPIPVYLVNPNTGTEGLSSWSAEGPFTVGASVQITGKDYKRTRVFVTNEDTSKGVRLTRTQGLSGFGFLLKAGATQEIATQDAVYACPAVAGDIVNVSVIVEYGIDGGY